MVTTTTKNITIGTLLILIATTLIIVVNMQHGLKIEVGKNETKFYIYNLTGDNNWTLSGTETWTLYILNKTYNPSTVTITNKLLGNNKTEITRISKYNTTLSKVVYNSTIIDKYTFDGNDQNIEAFPISHTINITCDKDCIYKYSYTMLNERMNIKYDATDKVGNNLYYQIGNSRIISIRMFDPIWYNISGNYTKNIPSIDPIPAYADSTLNCSIYLDMTNFTNITYANGTNYTIYIWYFKNNAMITKYSSTLFYNTTPNTIYTNGTRETLLRGDIWHCRMRATTTTGATLYTTPIMISNYLNISNSPPIITPTSPLSIPEVQIIPGRNNTTGGIKFTVGNYTIHNMTYTGANQTFNITSDIDINVEVKMWGAGGGGGYCGGWCGIPGTTASVGGGGGYTTVNITMKANQSYIVVVGQGGVQPTYGSKFGPSFGGGGIYCNANADCQYSGGGAGGSYIFNSTTLLLAAGGGGGGGVAYGGSVNTGGGAGGGTTGQDGFSTGYNCYGRAGTQLAGGIGGIGSYGGGIAGVFGIGGYAPMNSYGGSGGGGYYGGGGADYADTVSYHIMGGAGGGSGYILTGLIGSTTTGSGQTPANPADTDRGTAGNGGAINTAGNNGIIIMKYTPNASIIITIPTSVYTASNTQPTLKWTGTDLNNDSIRYEVYGEIQ